MTDYLRSMAAYVASQHHTRAATVRPADDQPDIVTSTADTSKELAVTEADSWWSR